MTPDRILQFALMTAFQIVFGLTKSGISSLLEFRNAEKIRDYVERMDKKFPGGSTADKRMGQIYEVCKNKLIGLTGRVQDDFYTTVGNQVRDVFAAEYRSKRCAMTPLQNALSDW